VLTVLKKTEGPVVLDADGLNALAGHPELLLLAKSPVILTPHMGEMARLCGLSIQEVQNDRVEIARAFAQKYKAVLVLKDASTVTASPNGDVYFNLTGSPALAKGGSGDCLAGIIAAFAAQKNESHGLRGLRCLAARSRGGARGGEIFELGRACTDLPAEFCSILAEHGV
jgi:NAD(P)H-hydrate epimerase